MTMQSNFIDLDELIVMCRDKRAKQLIQEAVACYRAGAYRSCIVATWNAVVFDFLHKLRELDLFGNGEAADLLKNFEKISSEAKVKELWQFESSIPDWAIEKFELISPVEQSDIQRLFEDRSRCAHPSMTSLEEPFEATAELARYHLRSAVTHLLQRPPVQGRAAKERIFQDIKSEYFPIEVELAVQHFQKSLLARARFTLIKDIVRGLTIDLLIESRLIDEQTRQFCALNAVIKLYSKQAGEILNDGLSDIILNKVTDENWDKVIIYLSTISAWEYLNEPCQLKAKKFIEKLNIFDENKWSARLSAENLEILVKSWYVSFLTEVVVSKFQISVNHILSAKVLCEDKVFIEKVLDPILKDSLPQADLNELIRMTKNADQLLSVAIQPCLQEAIQAAPIETLVYKILKTATDTDMPLIQMLESSLKEKITYASLEELLEANAKYKSIDEINYEIMELFKASITKLTSTVTFDELLEKYDYWNEIPDEVLEPILKENITTIVHKFIESNSFSNAANNAKLLIRVVEFLDPTQWQYILKAFCDNSQIHASYACPGIFIELFKKSLKSTGTIASYWLWFRQELDNNKNLKSVDTNSLKHLIDSSR